MIKLQWKKVNNRKTLFVNGKASIELYQNAGLLWCIRIIGHGVVTTRKDELLAMHVAEQIAKN